MGNYGSPDSSAFRLMSDAQTAKTNAIANTIDKLGSITADFITKRKEAAVAQKKVDAQKQIDVTDLMASIGVSWEGKDQGKRVSLFDVNRMGLTELTAMSSMLKTVQDTKIQKDRIVNIDWDKQFGPDTGVASVEPTGNESMIKVEKRFVDPIALRYNNLAFRPVVPAESGAMRAPSAYQPFVEKKNSSQQPMNTKQQNSQYLSTVVEVSTELGVDPNLASALVLTENASLNPKATSSAGAVGLLQLMPVTAREMGLNVGNGVDERTDPSKSISAGLGYFAKLTKLFGDDKLALAAYNAGPTRVASLLSKTGGTTYEDIEALLPAETRSYVPKVLSKLG